MAVHEGGFGYIFFTSDGRVKKVLKSGMNVGSYYNEVDCMRDAVGCPHIIQIIEVLESEHTIVMNRFGLSMYSLRYYNTLFTLSNLRTLIRGVVLGLKELHGVGWWHFDTHLKNILVTTDDTNVRITGVKLCDFGMSRRHGAEIILPCNCAHCKPVGRDFTVLCTASLPYLDITVLPYLDMYIFGLSLNRFIDIVRYRPFTKFVRDCQRCAMTPDLALAHDLLNGS